VVGFPLSRQSDELALLPGAVSRLRRLAEAGFRLIIGTIATESIFFATAAKWSSARIWPQ
jgi:hypothetical protein